MYVGTAFTNNKSTKQLIYIDCFVYIGGEIMATKDRESKKQCRRCCETSTDATKSKRTNAKKSNSTKACN